jgi:hypothetical protein
MVTQIRGVRNSNTYLFPAPQTIIPKLGSPKLRKETMDIFIFLSISTPENKRW